MVRPTNTEITDPLIYFDDRSSNHASGIWDFDDGQTQASNFNTINHIYSDTGTYQVSLTTISIDGCENYSLSNNYYFTNIYYLYSECFYPNNDLDNDYFMPILEGVRDFEMSIYDREDKEYSEQLNTQMNTAEQAVMQLGTEQ